MSKRLSKLRRQVKSKTHVFLTVPAVLCFITFISNLVIAIKDGYIDSAEYHTLLSTADGFETVVLVIIILFTDTKKPK